MEVAGKGLMAERQQIEAALQESEKRYKRLLEAVTDYIYSVKVEDGFAVVTSHGPGCVAVTGFTSQEYETDPHLWYRMIYEEDRDAVVHQTTRILSGEEVAPLEHRLIHKDGSIHWVRNTPVPRYNEQGLLVAYDGLITDITERKRMGAERERLLAMEREQHLLAETLGDVFLTLTSQTSRNAVLNAILYQTERIVPYSGAHIMLLDNKMLRMARWRGYETFGNDEFLADLEQSLSNFPLDAGVVESGRFLVIPNTQQNPQWVTIPELAWIQSFVAVPICLHDRVLGLLRLDSEIPEKFSAKDAECLLPLANAAAIALENARLYDQAQQELAERIYAEKELRRVALRNQAILDAIPDSMFYFNRAGQLLGYKAPNNGDLPSGIVSETIIGKKLNDLLPPDLADMTLQYLSQVLDSGAMQTFEYQLSLPEGLQDFEARLVVSGLNEVLAIMRNITRRKRMEEALKKSETGLAASEARLLAEMQSVLIVTHALVSEINLNNLLEFIMVQAEHLMNANGAVVLLLSDDGQQLEVATPGESWLRIKPGSRLQLKGSLAELALASQQVQISNCAPDDDLITSIRLLLPISACHSLLCAPLIIRYKNLGVLLIWSEQERVFTTQDNYLMTLFANQAALALHNAHLHAENRQLTIEQERHRLARELHDSVTQSLYSIGLAAQAALKLLYRNLPSDAQSPLEHIHTLSQIALTEMREQLYNLQPAALNKGLVTALAEHCHMLREQYALEIEFKADLDASLSIDYQHTLYYLVKEALWNVVKHARATHVNLIMSSENNQIVLSIADDGIGFEPSAITKSERLGLRNMKERTALLGGTFELQSRPGQGTRLTAQIPLRSHA